MTSSWSWKNLKILVRFAILDDVHFEKNIFSLVFLVESFKLFFSLVNFKIESSFLANGLKNLKKA